MPVITTLMRRREQMFHGPLPRCHDGLGDLDFTVVLDETDTKGRKLAFLHDDVLAPGVSIGIHRHEKQEPLAPDHPIRKAPRAILSSHRAGAHAEALLNIGRIVANDLEAVLNGLPPQEMQSAHPEYIRLRS